MRIKEFRSSDAAACAQLHKSTIQAISSKDYPPQAITAWIKTSNAKAFLKNMNDVHRFVALIDDEIVGFPEYLDNGEIHAIYVHKNHQRQGIATKLYEHIEQHAKKQGITEFRLTSTINAKKFYEKMGFQIIEKTEYRKKTVYEMKKTLTQLQKKI